jgi:hypothetical protein
MPAPVAVSPSAPTPLDLPRADGRGSLPRVRRAALQRCALALLLLAQVALLGGLVLDHQRTPPGGAGRSDTTRFTATWGAGAPRPAAGSQVLVLDGARAEGEAEGHEGAGR